ncbi:alpha/beta fold hydrolase, partial [Treponema pedis]
CILPDLLGAGYSDKPVDFEYTVTAHAEYLKDFITELGIKKLIIFGHSLGGAVAIELASLCGSLAAQLILSESNLDASKKGAVSYS